MSRPAPQRRLTITAHTMSRVADSFVPYFQGLGWEAVVRVPEGQFFSASELAEVSAGSEVVIIGDDEASKIFFEMSAPDLKLLIKWGVGTDSIDFAAADKFGVQVKNTPGVFSDEVADLALAYLLAIARQVVAVHLAALDDEWSQIPGVTLVGKTLGIVGFGSIGRAIADRSLGFGMNVLFYDPYFAGRPPGRCSSGSFHEVLTVADFLVLACPSNSETKGIMERRAFSLMKKGSSLINVARGDLVVENDLVTALAEKRLFGAALDVYESEPLPKHSRLRQFSNVILGAHNGSNTSEGLMRASRVAAEIVAEYTERSADAK